MQVCGGSLIAGGGGSGGCSLLVAVVGRGDGFNDPWVWWISVALVAVV